MVFRGRRGRGRTQENLSGARGGRAKDTRNVICSQPRLGRHHAGHIYLLRRCTPRRKWRRSSNLLHGVTRAQPASCILKTLAASRTACSSLPACISAAKNVGENSDKSGHCERRPARPRAFPCTATLQATAHLAARHPVPRSRRGRVTRPRHTRHARASRQGAGAPCGFKQPRLDPSEVRNCELDRAGD